VDGAVTFGVALAVALVVTPLTARVAVKAGVLDHPGALKVHDRPVPYLGGVAVFVALGVAALGGGTQPSWLLPLFGALVLGVVDDVVTISPRIRLVCEVLIGAVAGVVVPMGPLGMFGTAGAVVLLINAVNLLDGLDGLASGVALVSALGFALLGGEGFVLALAAGGALSGFLFFNRPPARIYLGDGGSYLLGTALAVLAAATIDEGTTGAAWVVVVLLVSVPLLDTAIAIVRRLRSNAPLFAGDRSHVYDQLVDRGCTRTESVVVCIAVQAVMAAVAVAAWHAPALLGTALGGVALLALAGTALATGFASPSGGS